MSEEPAGIDESSFKALNFYTYAYIIYKKLRQQNSERLLKDMESNKAPSKISNDLYDVYSFINAWALILSQKRRKTKNSALEVTATALQKTECNVQTMPYYKYCLYIAKNGGLDDKDRVIMKRAAEWMALDDQQDCNLENASWKLILTHTSKRIKSYINCRLKNKFRGCLYLLEQTWGSSGTIFLDDMRFILTEIEEVPTEPQDLNIYSDLLVKCHKFIREHDNVIKNNTVLEQYSQLFSIRNDLLLFAITSVRKLAKIPQAFSCMIKFRKTHFSSKDEFQVVEIKACDERFIIEVPRTSIISRLNHSPSEIPGYTHMEDELADVAGGFERANSDIRTKVKVHCEMQLVNHVLNPRNNIKLDDMVDFIGCSKKPCFLCASTLLYGTSFRFINPHWKVYWAWGIPKNLMENRNISGAIVRLQGILKEVLLDKNAKGVIPVPESPNTIRFQPDSSVPWGPT
ncbi:hypothetical protein M426DRAFT_27284 [Hypoxylon sp. CI-4A]|nr:hypothetical protein M426DRAFT_27284 [Hypoxylon sp. CI-4A]